MATKKVFLHGVPDTPAVWGPLLASLALPRDQVVTLSLPGFEKPAPTDFGGTKDDYARWLVGEIEPLHDEFGPVDIVGHDWGALLTQRAVSLRPELFRSWVISDALIEKSYPGHRNARLMNMPLVVNS